MLIHGLLVTDCEHAGARVGRPLRENLLLGILIKPFSARVEKLAFDLLLLQVL